MLQTRELSVFVDIEDIEHRLTPFHVGSILFARRYTIAVRRNTMLNRTSSCSPGTESFCCYQGCMDSQVAIAYRVAHSKCNYHWITQHALGLVTSACLVTISCS